MVKDPRGTAKLPEAKGLSGPVDIRVRQNFRIAAASGQKIELECAFSRVSGGRRFRGVFPAVDNEKNVWCQALWLFG